MNDDEFERLKNFTIFKVWATDKEMESLAPVFVVILFLFGIAAGLIWLLS